MWGGAATRLNCKFEWRVLSRILLHISGLTMRQCRRPPVPCPRSLQPHVQLPRPRSYEERINYEKNPIAHPSAPSWLQMQTCDSPSSILVDQVRGFHLAWSRNRRLIKWLSSTMNVLTRTSAVCRPRKFRSRDRGCKGRWCESRHIHGGSALQSWGSRLGRIGQASGPPDFRMPPCRRCSRGRCKKREEERLKDTYSISICVRLGTCVYLKDGYVPYGTVMKEKERITFHGIQVA